MDKFKKYSSKLLQNKKLKQKQYKKKAEDFLLKPDKSFENQLFQKITSANLTLPLKRPINVLPLNIFNKDNNNSTSAIIFDFNSIDKNKGNSSKSIFLDIEKNYQKLVSTSVEKSVEENIEELLREKLNNRSILKFSNTSVVFDRYLSSFNTTNFSKELLKSIVSNQDKINRRIGLFEIQKKYQGIPIAKSFFRKKFSQRCNQLTMEQKLGGQLMTPSQVDGIIEEMEVNVERRFENHIQEEPSGTEMAFQFPDCSFLSPIPTKINYDEINMNRSALEPAILSGNSIIQFTDNSLSNSDLLREFGITNNEPVHCNRNVNEEFLEPILSRPKKTVKKKSPFFSNSGQMIKLPICRKLQYDDEFSDTENEFNCKPLEKPLFDIPLTPSPIPNIITPNEYFLRQKYAPATLTKVILDSPPMKKFAIAKRKELPPPPSTPEIKFYPKFQF